MDNIYCCGLISDFMFIKENKAQGALEYLLIIGGAIVLAAIVIAIVINVVGDTKGTVSNKLSDFNKIIDINAEGFGK